MSYVVINAITVPPGKGEALEERFANRAGEVSMADGFESFELLRPTGGESGDEYFVYTRWASKGAFEAWMNSPAFGRGHAGSSGRPSVGSASRVLAYEVVQREEKAAAG